MKHHLTIKEQDIVRDAPIVDTSNFKEREAARAVMLDANNQVYLLNVSKHGYHKLPGGGIDEGEGTEQALGRELMEEIGCKAEIISELGMIVEFRDYDNLKQTSYCYLAKQVGEQQAAHLEEGEIEEGLQEVKAKSIDDAIAILEHDEPDNLEGKFIQKRDIYILKTAKQQATS